MYVPNTLVPKDTWENSGQTVLNTNPIVLDSRGQALIYGSGTYRQIVKDSDSNIIWDELTNGLGFDASAVYSFDTTSDLLTAFSGALTLPNGTQANTSGRTAVGDGGGGSFYYDSSDTTTLDNGGTIRVDSANRRWFFEGTAVTTSLFGSFGDGSHDDTSAINNALNAISVAGGGIVSLPAGNFKTTSTITVPNFVYLNGAGRGVSIIKPNGTFSQCIIASGSSYASWADSIRIGNLEIDGTNLTGNGLVVKWCGLRCYFHDLYIHSLLGSANSDTAGVGMRVISSFDHCYDRIECRHTASYPVEIYEEQLIPDGVYNELSFLRFYDIQALDGNGGGVQWNQAGGDNCEFWIKPSQGSIGFQVTRNSFSMRVHSLFYDDPGSGNGVAADLNAAFANDYYFENIYGFSNKYNVQITLGVNTYIGNSFINSSTVGKKDVHVTSTATSPVYLTVPNVSYLDDNSTSIVYPAADTGTWTPTLQGAGASLGNGMLSAIWSRSGNRISLNINFTIGSTTVMPASGFGLTVPTNFPGRSGQFFTGEASAYDLSATTWYPFSSYVSGTAIVFPYGATFVDSTVPFMWATGDLLNVTIQYFIN